MSDYPMLSAEQIDEIDDYAGERSPSYWEIKALVSMARFSLKAAAEWQGADGKAEALERENQQLRSDAHLAREAMAAVQVDLKKAEDELAKYRENEPLVRLVQMLGLGEPVRPDIHALVRHKLEAVEKERDAALADASRARTLLAEALSFATCSGFDLNERYGRYLELCAIAGALASKNGDGE